ncbi:hypothetical protein AVEN_238465-1 [Araneus ventricosus]|uniref:Complex I assembly factor TIMMDC1, mitochondrial n=1 Tax=Araneus ventricosus TaxID=182803 RepID=A0A4Y2SQ89_ARAVE|nr:hypothetical protein AVEN_238465-1 [Araneus ventricosus]
MIFPFLKRSVHCSSDNFPIITEKGIKDELSKETGWDRVQRMYSTDEFGVSPEMNYVLTTGRFAVVFAAFFGGMGGMIKAKEEFSRRNKAANFESLHVAKRGLTDAMTMGLLKGGTTAAVKYGSFTCLYFLTTMTVANYRNKISVWEHVASAAVLGGFSRINYGLKGVAVAGVLGGVLGLIAGGFITMTMGVDGMTMDEFRCWLQEEHYVRLQQKSLKEVKETS